MKAVAIKDDVYWVGVQDPNLKIFDIVIPTEHGTSYNAYLVKGTEKTALIETVKWGFFEEYLEDLQKTVDITQINYLIVNHTEPDHSGSVEKLLQLIPDLVIMGSPTALKFLREISNSRFNARELLHGDEINLGGKTLQVINAPFLHWPDSIYTYLKEDRILFSCDSFGSHWADERIFNDLIPEDLTPDLKYYFDHIMGPFKPYVLEAMDKIQDLEIDIICPGHGPVLRTNIDSYVNCYRQWATPTKGKEDERLKIVMAYVTAYGYTGMIADSIAEGLGMIADFNIKKYNLSDVDVKEVLADIASADGLLIGSPTINGDTLPPIWELLVRLSPIIHNGKVAAAFGAYGWSGEAVPNIENRLRMLRMKVRPGLRINFKPSARNLEDAFTFGLDFGRALLLETLDNSAMEWRCVVCGHMHRGAQPPEQCPACGVGRENFVQAAPEDEFRHDTEDHFVVVGGGIAALSAVEAIRRRNDTARITMVSDEALLPYYRPALSDYLGEELADERFYVKPPSWYDEQRIEAITATRVKAINSGKRELDLSNGEKLAYNKLILATGARSNIPDLPGVDCEGVYALRSYQDAQSIKDALEQARQVVVIGGGVLGLEAAWEISQLGKQVAIIEHNSRLMPRQLDADASQRLETLARQHGVQLYLARDVRCLQGNPRVSGVELTDGQVLNADLVLLSTGVKPNLELAQTAGIETDRGIVVDAGMRTSTSDIYAAGDVAQFGGSLIGLWPTAVEMGRIAGANAAGDWLEYQTPTLSTLLAAFDMEIFSLGDVNPSPEETRVVEVWDPLENYYKKSFIKEGIMVGEIVIAPRVAAGESLAGLGRDAAGNRKVVGWECRVCGYRHEGPEPPEECPVCGAGRDMFDPIYADGNG